MNCPKCETKMEVTDSRMTKSGFRRRRMRCDTCGRKVTSYEVRFDEATNSLMIDGIAENSKISEALAKYAREALGDVVKKQLLEELAKI